ncbi:MAG: ferrous iron transport protein B [Pseudomonadota bacterium]|nr:ferrous iron transport protein B [Pseudomonadota bacterium]
MKRIALLGNPNSGKTTLFNALTKQKNKTANWSGVTVEISRSCWHDTHSDVEIIDLPGCYSICNSDTSGSPDEVMAADFLLENQVDCVINIIDSSNLSRSLYLTTQLIELGTPIIVILNKTDLVTHYDINVKQLSEKLANTTIIQGSANDSQSIKTIKESIKKSFTAKTGNVQKNNLINYSKNINTQLKKIESILVTRLAESFVSHKTLALHLISGSKPKFITDKYLLEQSNKAHEYLVKQEKVDVDIIIAQDRYDFIRKALTASMIRKEQNTINKKTDLTEKIDRLLTHKYFGIVSLITILYAMFAFTINIGSSLQEFFTTIGELFFITGTQKLLQVIATPKILQTFLVQGLGQGICTLLSFVPIVFAMFYSINMLEESGYMPRAAYVTDRLMRLLQLPGKAFIPLIIGFSCNVPAVLATRTLESKRERIIAGLMTPFMMCNARLAVFAIFANAFFPENSSLVIFGLYFTGIAIAIITGLIVCHLILPGKVQPLIMELPNYQLPKQRLILSRTWSQTISFCYRVGLYIISLSAIISILSSIEIKLDSGNLTALALIGKAITPLFYPLGITDGNWAASVSILSGFAAKETVIITLSQLYHETSNIVLAVPYDFFAYATQTIYDAFFDLLPFNSGVENLVPTVNSFNEQLKFHFQTSHAAAAYMLFNLLYMPCISTVFAFAKETNWGWAIFSMSWSFTIAYTLAMLVYQVTQMQLKLIFILAVLGLIVLALNILLAKSVAKRNQGGAYEFN